MTYSLEHHGVKGMRWGVHKDTNASTGGSTNKAEKKAARHQLYKHLAVVGSIIALGVLSEKGPEIMTSISKKAEFNRGRDAIPALMDHAQDLKYSKQRGGVYNITSL